MGHLRLEGTDVEGAAGIERERGERERGEGVRERERER